MPDVAGLAFAILGAAVLLGSLLFVLFLRGGRNATLPPPLALLHGAVGLVGLACLVLVVRAPPSRIELSTAGFDTISAVLIAAAAVLGIAMLAMHQMKRGRPGSLIGIHALLAVSGFVILAAYVLV